MPLEELGRKLYPPHIPTQLEIPDWRVFDLLRHSMETYPDHDALAFYQSRWTYRQVWENVNRTARALQDRGLSVGDRVALMLPNCPAYVFAYYGVLLAGGIVTQINPMLSARELEYVLNDSGSWGIMGIDSVLAEITAVRPRTALKHVIGVSLKGTAAGPDIEDFDTMLRTVPSPSVNPVSIEPDSVAVLQYTGGTTGRSKGAMLTHRNLVANVLQAHTFNELHAGEERTLAVIPLFHVYGMTVALNLGIHMGSLLVLLPRFDLAEVLDAIRTHHITLWPGVPTMYIALLQVPDLPSEVGSIRICNSGSAPMPVEMIATFEQRTGGHIAEGYGLTEASPITHTHGIWMTRKPGTVGIPLPSTEFRIVDPHSLKDVPLGEPGELWIRGPQVMKGYWNQPEETKATLVDGGWLRTGDLVSCDEEGYVTIIDRLKDLIIVGGYNVYPREVEEVLYTHPSVVEAVVVGAPDAYRGETVRAVVVPKAGSGLTETALREYLAKNLAKYKQPSIIELRDALPKSAVGKILRRVVREERLDAGHSL